MEKIRLADVKSLHEYEKTREASRRSVIATKRRRRVTVGDRLSFLFENRETVLFQIQEMVRAERIVAGDRVQDEVDVYNALVPEPGELSATMMIEIEEKSQIQPVLDSLLGIDSGEYVWLAIGRDFAVPGRFEEGHSKEDRIAAVHFVRFPLTLSQRRAFGREPVALVADHPSYRARTELSADTRAALLEDLEERAPSAESRH